MGISFWLVPAAVDAVARLQGIITELAHTHASPVFPPHITLLTAPSETSLEHLRASAASLPAQDVRFDAVQTGATFYQSVFIAIRPSPALDSLQALLAGRLGLSDVKMPHFPHLSLYYGHDKKSEIAQRLHTDGITGPRQDGDGIVVDGIDGFVTNQVWIVRCDGPVAEWSVLARVDLQ